MRIAQEEIFGPVLGLMEAADFDDTMRLANCVRFGLSASVVTNNANSIQRFINQIEAGLITVNLPPQASSTSFPSEAPRSRASECVSKDPRRSTFTRKPGRSISNIMLARPDHSGAPGTGSCDEKKHASPWSA